MSACNISATAGRTRFQAAAGRALPSSEQRRVRALLPRSELSFASDLSFAFKQRSAMRGVPGGSRCHGAKPPFLRCSCETHRLRQSLSSGFFKVSAIADDLTPPRSKAVRYASERRVALRGAADQDQGASFLRKPTPIYLHPPPPPPLLPLSPLPLGCTPGTALFGSIRQDLGRTPPAGSTVTASAARLNMGRSTLVGDHRSDPAWGGTARETAPSATETPCHGREGLRSYVDHLLAK